MGGIGQPPCLFDLIFEVAESGSRTTLYLYGLSHAFAQPHLPIPFSDEAGKRVLRLGATLTTTCPEVSIRATLSHELYMKFTDRKLRRSQALRGVVLEHCVLSASPEWRVIAERIIRPLMAQSSIRVLCHHVTQSILLQPDPTVLEHDMYCMCRHCGTKRSGVRQWIAFSIEILQGWPTFWYVAVAAFLPRRQRKAKAKARDRRGKNGGLFLCPARLAWQLYLTQPMSTHRQSTCHHRMYPGQRVPPNAPSLHEQRSCTGTSWLMLRIQQILIPSQMQGHAVVVAVTMAVAVAVAGAVGVAVPVVVVVAVMKHAMPSPLAVPMWRLPLLLH